jgi:hypothetical protein
MIETPLFNLLHEQQVQSDRFLNQTAETVPPFAVMWVSGNATTDDRGKLTYPIIKPNAEAQYSQGTAQIMFNGDLSVKSGELGEGTFTLPAFARSAQSFPMGTLVGPEQGQWELNHYSEVFTVRSAHTSGSDSISQVVPNSASVQYAIILDVISTTACAAADIIPANYILELPQRVRTKKFQAAVLKAITNPIETTDLWPTGEIVTVENKFDEPMEVGQYLTIGRRRDGIWVILVWPCDDFEASDEIPEDAPAQ